MPCYLVHGFRWPRRAIRIHIILENIDEAAAEYISEPATSAAMLETLRDKFPRETALLPRLRFVEQYDPLDESARALSQPYAFVADEVKAFDLSVDVLAGIAELEAKLDEPVGAGAGDPGDNGAGKAENGAAGETKVSSATQKHEHFDLHRHREDKAKALEAIKQKLAPDEKIGWWVVYNGDEGRRFDGSSSSTHRETGSRDEAKRNRKGLRKLFGIKS